ncbi:DUF1707 SHOCT-like domain-containing protein [Actinocrispum wychmicini]|uniref:Uncharacterized protein DUF1707 n=1 Tax=Actinocrispum wychmicini TaxID=1213861 RepID=A0A4R2JXS1_9PSEU|nr:DUF1707 domain-containing protein [Actinocrispum wychmicini]TCO65363.1 uncharacterized protein DUF1707 [Actinocrispum wychmicini]
MIEPDRMRVSDIDRQATEARLRVAHAEGSLTLTELDDRLVGLWQAKTRGDLALLTMDLPAPAPPTPPPPKPRPSALKVLAAIWLSVSVLNATIWLIISVTTVSLVYPWFIWVLMPPGVVLGSVWMMTRKGR